MVFPDRDTVIRLRSEYPRGTLLELVEMDDPYRKMPAGLKGIVRGVDDTGSLMVSWLNGSTLNVVYGVDRIRAISHPLTADDLSEMHGLPVWLVPSEADLRWDERIGFYLVNANDLALLNADGRHVDFDAVTDGQVYVYGGGICMVNGKMKVIMVEPNKPAYVTEIGAGLRDMQAVVGGLIQAIYPYEEMVCLVMNDEGKLEGLPLNRALCDAEGEIYDIIAGTFFCCGLSEDNFASIPDELIDKFLNLFREPETFIQVGEKIFAPKSK
jgi:hypothetical protein